MADTEIIDLTPDTIFSKKPGCHTEDFRKA